MENTENRGILDKLVKVIKKLYGTNNSYLRTNNMKFETNDSSILNEENYDKAEFRAPVCLKHS